MNSNFVNNFTKHTKHAPIYFFLASLYTLPPPPPSRLDEQQHTASKAIATPQGCVCLLVTGNPNPNGAPNTPFGPSLFKARLLRFLVNRFVFYVVPTPPPF